MKTDYIKQKIKIKIKNIRNYIRCRFCKSNFIFDPQKKYVFIFLAADYNNLGDIAITISQNRYIANTLPDYEVVEITHSQTYGAIKEIKKLNKNNVIITIIGGGNNGTLYEFLEEPRRCILKELPMYKIVSFPQTVVYESSERGKPYLEEFQNLCKHCTDLTLIAREAMSCETYKTFGGAKILLTPDIVFSLDKFNYDSNQRELWVAAIMRDDKEKSLPLTLQNQLLSCIMDYGYPIIKMDTCDVNIQNGKEIILWNYLKKLSHASFAITDRLHGMILCYITRTPCIVIDNNNGKIKSTFETWLTDQNFIRLYDASAGETGLLSLVCSLVDIKETIAEDLNSKFNLLEEVLK